MSNGISRRIREVFGADVERIDDWINRNKGLGDVCFRNDVTVIFPTGCRKGEPTPRGPREMDCSEAVEQIRDTMTKAFGGSTSWSGRGTWVDTAGAVVGDPVAVIMSAHHCTDKKKAVDFASTLRDLGEKTKQETLSIKGTDKFLIIDPRKIRL